ncbi:unnamed protein product [Paramecium octaurelia]|uniref:Ankyrin repeat protein n=1 Tax=Paramecium octaurelia TaxID=43137 RepID=A0A8S1VYM3_PAROT|nr:unnamed protein product [Paramecium octaurelia]
MKRIQNLIANGKQFLIDSYSIHKSKQALKAYEKQQYKKIISQCQYWNSYKYIQINQHKFLFFLISEQNNDLIKQILDRNPIKEQILGDDENPNNFFPLTFSVLNDVKETSEVLIENGANINQVHKDGNNITHVCAFFNKIQALNYCIEKGVNYEQQNERGDTPLHLASMQGHCEIIERLLNLKCNVNIENTEHHQPIHESVLFGQLDAFKILFKYYQGIQRSSQSPHIVHYASMLENIFILSEIIKSNKALVNLRDPVSNAVPLHFSVNSNSLECTSLLLESGALPNVKDKFGNTPLHLAVEKKNIEICKLLCLRGADIDIENEDKLTAKDLAEVDVDRQILALFQSQSRYSNLFRQ